MNRRSLPVIALALLVCSSIGLLSTRADVTDTKVPLNYNFHGLVQPTDWSLELIPANADRPNSYRSIERRGMIWDPASVHSIGHYSATFAGPSSIPYAFFDTLGYSATANPAEAATNRLDIVHLGDRCTVFTLEHRPYDTDSSTPIGDAPAWSVCDHTGLQTTTLAAPIVVDEATRIGFLAQMAFRVPLITTYGGFDVMLGFSDFDFDPNTPELDPIPVHCVSHSWSTLTTISLSWFSQPYRAALAGRNIGATSYNNWQADGLDEITGDFHYDAPVYTDYASGNSAPNLNMMEYVINFAQIVSGVPMIEGGPEPAFPPTNIVGKHLTSISFGFRPESQYVYPSGTANTSAQILAATVRTGSGAANYSCASAVTISSGLTPGSTALVPVDPACVFVPAVNNPPQTIPAHFESPLTPCSGTGVARSDIYALWYKYTPSADATVTADTLNSTIGFPDTIITVYTACGLPPSVPSSIACNNDSTSPASKLSRVSWSATAGTAYYIRVSGRNNAYVNFILNITGPSGVQPGVCCRGSTCTTTIGGSPATAANCNANPIAGAQAGGFFQTTAPSGCNAPGNFGVPCCHGDYNKAGGITVQDIFDFLSDWFAGSPFAVTGGDGNVGTVTVQNIFDFLSVWFGGC